MYIYIKAMSESLSEIRDDIKSTLGQLDKHLIKLILFENADSRSYWKDEVYSFLNSVRRARGSKRFPKYKFIRSVLAIDEDILDNYIKQVKSDYKHLVCSNVSDVEVATVILAYHDWIAGELSTTGAVTRDQVMDELSALGL